MNQELPFCACGCGNRVAKKGNRFIHNHHKGNLGHKHSPETRKKISIATSKGMKHLKGIPFSPEHCKAISLAQKGIHRTDEQKAAIKEGRIREKPILFNGYESQFLSTNKDCSNYLGDIAERILSKVYPNVKVMGYQNVGFDFICNSDLKIDVKSSATGYKKFWQFNIKKNKVADYFLCLAFDDRNNLKPIYLWSIPGYIVNHLTGIKICRSNLDKWLQYEQPLNKVILCCDEMRGKQWEY